MLTGFLYNIIYHDWKVQQKKDKHAMLSRYMCGNIKG